MGNCRVSTLRGVATVTLLGAAKLHQIAFPQAEGSQELTVRIEHDDHVAYPNEIDIYGKGGRYLLSISAKNFRKSVENVIAGLEQKPSEYPVYEYKVNAGRVTRQMVVYGILKEELLRDNDDDVYLVSVYQPDPEDHSLRGPELIDRMYWLRWNKAKKGQPPILCEVTKNSASDPHEIPTDESQYVRENWRNWRIENGGNGALIKRASVNSGNGDEMKQVDELIGLKFRFEPTLFVGGRDVPPPSVKEDETEQLSDENEKSVRPVLGIVDADNPHVEAVYGTVVKTEHPFPNPTPSPPYIPEVRKINEDVPPEIKKISQPTSPSPSETPEFQTPSTPQSATGTDDYAVVVSRVSE